MTVIRSDSTAAAIQFSDGLTLIFYQDGNGSIHQVKGVGPVVSAGTTYVDEKISAAENARDGTPLAVTTGTPDQIRLYFINKGHLVRELIRSCEGTQPGDGFDSKQFTTQKNSTLLYAINGAATSPTVGFQSAAAPDFITEARFDGGWGSTIVRGQKNFVTLVNGTPYRWDLLSAVSSGMSSWSFPSFIGAGKSISVYLGRDAAAASCWGEATYILDGTDNVFQVKAKGSRPGSIFTLEVFLLNMTTQNNKKGTTIDLGWTSTRPVNFILSGEVGAFSSTNMPTDWMQTNLSRLANRTLRRLCIPGSHDAGMYTASHHTLDVSVIAQSKPIGGQLNLGTRYFDIRPVFDKRSSTYYTGHYTSGTKYGFPIYAGANGEPIDDIINEINSFTADNKELVILRLSHDIEYEDKTYSYQGHSVTVRQGSAFSQARWDDLFERLKQINHRFIAENPTTVDLTTLKLGRFIEHDPAVVIVVKLPSGVVLGNYANKGFYLYSQLNSYNKYTNTPDTNEMALDQIKQMHEIRTSPDSRHFILSWTLTKNAFGGTIQKLAHEANPELYKRLILSSKLQSYPNVLYTDAIDNSDSAALSMLINNYFGRS